MSIQVFRDIEEALAREVRRITFNDSITVSKRVLQDIFDPFTGELVSAPIEPSFYDSSADANHIQYPNFFIRLLKTKEDRTSGRVVPYYGKPIVEAAKISSKAYEILDFGTASFDPLQPDAIVTQNVKIKKIVPNNLLRILNGPNKGTYIVDSTVVAATALDPHIINLKSTLLLFTNTAIFELSTRKVYFESSVDLKTVAAGDLLEDSVTATFAVVSIDLDTNSIELGGTGSPNLSSGGLITRNSPILQNDPSLMNFIVMDHTKPVITSSSGAAADSYISTDYDVPLDAYYLIRIDSKERDTHVDVLNRVWEEFNPPRTGLPILERTELSAEQKLTEDLPAGGSSTVTVSDNAEFEIGEEVYVINDLRPTRNEYGEFETPFKSKIVAKISTNKLQLAQIVPDSYTIALNTKVISNSCFKVVPFHFVDHVTKDNEGAQYFVHEFTFLVQLWVKKFGKPKTSSAVTDVSYQLEDFDGNSYT